LVFCCFILFTCLAVKPIFSRAEVILVGSVVWWIFFITALSDLSDWG
jgi:hypothetical protein